MKSSMKKSMVALFMVMLFMFSSTTVFAANQSTEVRGYKNGIVYSNAVGGQYAYGKFTIVMTDGSYIYGFLQENKGYGWVDVAELLVNTMNDNLQNSTEYFMQGDYTQYRVKLVVGQEGGGKAYLRNWN